MPSTDLNLTDLDLTDLTDLTDLNLTDSCPRADRSAVGDRPGLRGTTPYGAW